LSLPEAGARDRYDTVVALELAAAR
jgi:hypothetical protein